MIKVNKITPFTCEFFTPEGKSLGFLNEYEFNDLRVQIKNESAEGYYAMYNETKILIDKDARIGLWFEGFYDTIEKQLSQLLGF